MRSRFASTFLLAVLALAAVPACKPADAATIVKSSPQAFTPLISRAIFATGDQSALTITGANGDAEGNYRCHGEIVHKGNSGNTTYVFRPFDPTANTGLSSLFEYNNGSAVYVASNSGSPSSLWHVEFEGASSDTSIIFNITVFSRTGYKRQFYSNSTSIRVGAGVATEKSQGWTTNTSTNITSLTIAAQDGSAVAVNAIRAGSYMKCQADGDTQ